MCSNDCAYFKRLPVEDTVEGRYDEKIGAIWGICRASKVPGSILAWRDRPMMYPCPYYLRRVA